MRVNSPSNSAISDSPLPVSGWDYAFYDQEQRRTGGCTGDHLERVTSPPGEEGPTELVLAVQGASPEPPQPCHELPYPTPLELISPHLRPLSSLGKENVGEKLEDEAIKGLVSESVLLTSKLDAVPTEDQPKQVHHFQLTLRRDQ